MKRATVWVLGGCFLVAGCRREATQEQGQPPPPEATPAVAGVCSGGGGKIADAIASKLLPQKVLAYCLDPNNEVRVYGKDAKGTIEQVCTELFDGECEVYRSFGLERVVAARYADGSGAPATVTVNLSRFESVLGALGFFTKRVIGDADPASLTMDRFDAGGLAVQGSGTAYLWRGTHVVELSYANDNESPEELKVSGRKITGPLASAVGELLPGDKQLPGVARLLPEEDRLPLGLGLDAKDALGIAGVGAGAMGYYRREGKRFRILALERPNEESAKDVVKTLKRQPLATELKGVRPYVQLTQRTSDAGGKLEWFFGREGASVIGVGDEEHVLAADGKASPFLSSTEKQEELAKVLSSVQKRQAEK